MRQLIPAICCSLLFGLLAGCAASSPTSAPPAVATLGPGEATALPAPSLIPTSTVPPPGSSQAAGTTPTATNTAVPAGPATEAEKALAPLQAALSGYDNTGTDAARVINPLRAGVTGYLAASPQPLTQATADALLAYLANLLHTQEDPVGGVADLDQDGKPDFLLATPFMYGVPAFAFLGGDSYRSIPLPPEAVGSAVPDAFLPAAWPSAVSAVDVTGDGRAETVVEYQLPGGSGFTIRPYLFRWSPEKRSFDTVFRADLVNWAGKAAWQMEPAATGGQEIVLTGPAFGVFDHKLLPHPVRTQVWRWDGKVGRFVKAEESVSPPETRRQQVNAGEALLRAGEYDQAAPAYRQAIEDASLKDEPGDGSEPGTDWRAFAWLRLGETYALLDRPADAQAALAQAGAAGGAIGQLAKAFAAAYQGPDGVVAAWASMSAKVDLPGLLYNGKGGNLGFPVSAFDVAYPGLAVAAYLDRHNDALNSAPELVATQLGELAVPIKTAVIADVDGDGQKDFAFVTADKAGPDQPLDHVWLAYRSGGRWRMGILAEGPSLVLDETIPLGAGGAIVAVRYPDGFDPQVVGYSWREGPITYDLRGPNPKENPEDPWPTIGLQ